jgi:threonine dehydrogenase-like Zn-dependent dehydrogenase
MMLAARAYRGDHELRLERVAVPELREGEALVQVRAASLTRGLLSVWYFTDLMKCLPSVPGHEIAGVVHATEGPAGAFRPGDRVVVHTPLSCGHCRFCRTGRESMCVDLGTIGHGFYGHARLGPYERYHDGGLAEYVRVPAGSLMRLPDEVSFAAGARVPTLASSFRVLKLTGVSHGDTVVVAGATGSSGAAAVKCAPLVGATRVIAIARGREALERLREVASVRVDAIPTDELPAGWEESGGLTDRILALTGGHGTDGVADFMPAGAEVTTQCIQAMRRGATAVLIGGNPSTVPLDYLRLMQGQWQIRGFRGVLREDERELLELMASGRLRTDDLITHRFGLARVNEAIGAIFGRRESPMFVVVTP